MKGRTVSAFFTAFSLALAGAGCYDGPQVSELRGPLSFSRLRVRGILTRADHRAFSSSVLTPARSCLPNSAVTVYGPSLETLPPVVRPGGMATAFMQIAGAGQDVEVRGFSVSIVGSAAERSIAYISASSYGTPITGYIYAILPVEVWFVAQPVEPPLLALAGGRLPLEIGIRISASAPSGVYTVRMVGMSLKNIQDGCRGSWWDRSSQNFEIR